MVANWPCVPPLLSTLCPSRCWNFYFHFKFFFLNQTIALKWQPSGTGGYINRFVPLSISSSHFQTRKISSMLTVLPWKRIYNYLMTVLMMMRIAAGRLMHNLLVIPFVVLYSYMCFIVILFSIVILLWFICLCRIMFCTGSHVFLSY